MITDAQLESRLIAERAAAGSDRWDEVWDGVYVMAPLPNNEHQLIAIQIASALLEIIAREGRGQVFQGVNVSDRDDNWQENYRCPDVAAFLNGGTANDRGAYWRGGPDFAVEIASEGDRTRAKLPFYASVRTRELLILDRDPWQLELFRLKGDKLTSVAVAGAADAAPITSNVIPFTFRLVPAKSAARPTLELTCPERHRTWSI